MHDDDVKQLFAYMAAPPAEPSCSVSSDENDSSDEDEDPNNQSMVWAHNSTSEQDVGSEPEDVGLTETVAALSPIKRPIVDDDTSGSSSDESIETGDDKMTCEDVKFAKMAIKALKYLSSMIDKLKSPRQSNKRPVFKVPSHGHAQFSGDPETLESFIVHMQLAHSEFTTGAAASEDNPEFIFKLVDYFTHGSSVRQWFEAFAIRRRELKLKLSWDKLVKALRQDYGIRDQMEEHLNKFHAITQGKDTIQSYIAKKKTAALLVKEHITPLVLLFAFLQGLRIDVAEHVRGRLPKSVEEAQSLAITYEQIQRGNKRTAIINSKPINIKNDESKQLLNKRKVAVSRSSEQMIKKVRTQDQQAAYEDLIELRRNKCFSCGANDHRKEGCTASAGAKDAHYAKVRTLRTKINQ
jgi:hypothetical protein